jgi:3-isopropylmalate/(R)-2-methylmalate dehydratase small subunit
VSAVVRGRAWRFPEANVNTDLMMPAALFRLPRSKQAAEVFGAYRPGWAQQVRAGDVLVGGRNFGTGSSRPAPALMAELGIRAVLAESLNGLFFRNCINHGVYAADCPGIIDAVDELDVVAYEPETGTVTNDARGRVITASALPPELIAIVEDGGLQPRLERGGYLERTPRP